MRSAIKVIVFAAAVVAVVAGGIGYYRSRDSGPTVAYRTAQVKRGDLVATIGATGTIEPEEVVDVGAQVAGQVLSFGKDADGNPVDYNSVVNEGTVLAKIDSSLYAADEAQSEANLQQARNGVPLAEANLAQAKAKADQAEADWNRAQKLGPSEALAETQYDAYKYGYAVAKANVAVSEAALAQARSAVAQAQASLDRAKRNLSYCTITSPVKGVIVDRRVNIGQTVVSSLNAPSLFLIAKDLKRMQVWVSVNEADIGSIHPGQAVAFTVDAYPGRVFRGQVGKVRLNATMTQNVVTYTVEVLTDNSSGKLLPYLTANAQFDLEQRHNVLLVPNAALRWFPQPEQVVPEARAMVQEAGRRAGGGGGSGGTPAARPPTSQPATQPGSAVRGQGLLWVRQGPYVAPIKVAVGLSDGSMTEVRGNELKDGMEVITGEQQAANNGGTTNPFTPNIGRH